MIYLINFNAILSYSLTTRSCCLTPANNLNNDLKAMNEWAFQWKMSFNPDPTKQDQEVIFSRKATKKNHPKIFFNNIPVS